jgi:phage terminase large subunit-like protein
MFGLRRGRYPRAMVTTTPRPTRLLRRLIGRGDVERSGGRTADNVMLAGSFVDYVTGLYAGTRLGRQELDGELIEEVQGSLWPLALIERARASIPLPDREGSGVGPAEGGRNIDSEEGSLPLAYPPPAPPFQGGGFFRRIVIGVDPPASAGGTCGIVACGVDTQGVGYVLGDHSVAGLGPEGWARKVAAAAEAWGAERVVAETNQGGEMVASVLRSVDPALPVKCVQARYGKAARAEPVAVKFEIGMAKFAGIFPELEDELTGMTVGGGYEGPGRSPDRADAMVWALTELLLGKPRAEPRISML